MANVALSTTTFYKQEGDPRVRLAVKTMDEAERLGLDIVVVDGGSHPSVVFQICNDPGRMELNPRMNVDFLIEPVKQTMGAGRRQALAAAAEIAGPDGIVVWLEPEKHDIIRDIARLVQPILDGKADIAIPNRVHLMEDYPSIQAKEESLANHALYLITGVKADYYVGPRAISVKALKYFMEYNAKARGYEDKWDAIFVPLLDCLVASLKIVSVDVDYRHPQEQKAQEEGNPFWEWKRMEQFLNIVPPMFNEAKKLGICKVPSQP